MNKRKTLFTLCCLSALATGLLLGYLAPLQADVYFNSKYNRPCSWDYGSAK